MHNPLKRRRRTPVTPSPARGWPGPGPRDVRGGGAGVRGRPFGPPSGGPPPRATALALPVPDQRLDLTSVGPAL